MNVTFEDVVYDPENPRSFIEKVFSGVYDTQIGIDDTYFPNRDDEFVDCAMVAGGVVVAFGLFVPWSLLWRFAIDDGFNLNWWIGAVFTGIITLAVGAAGIYGFVYFARRKKLEELRQMLLWAHPELVRLVMREWGIAREKTFVEWEETRRREQVEYAKKHLRDSRARS